MIYETAEFQQIIRENNVLEYLAKQGAKTNKDGQPLTYTYGDTPVPRVTNIFRMCIGSEGLMYWAANAGVRKMEMTRKNATLVGSVVHAAIEQHFKDGSFYPMQDHISEHYLRQQALCAYDNFKLWLFRIEQAGYQLNPIAMEKHATSPYFGGTIDMIANINGANYIIDWKTSKSISIEYWMQVCAYRWLINSGYVPDMPHIHGIGIVRLPKMEERTFEDCFLTETIPDHNQWINYYTEAFFACLNWYYHQVNIMAKNSGATIVEVIRRLEEQDDR